MPLPLAAVLDALDARLVLWTAVGVLVLSVLGPGMALICRGRGLRWPLRLLLAGGGALSCAATIAFSGLAAWRAWENAAPAALPWAASPLPFAVQSAAILLPLLHLASRRTARGGLLARLLGGLMLVIVLHVVTAAWRVSLLGRAALHIDPASFAVASLLAILLLTEALRPRAHHLFGLLSRACALAVALLAVRMAQGEAPLANWGPSPEAAIVAVLLTLLLATAAATLHAVARAAIGVDTADIRHLAETRNEALVVLQEGRIVDANDTFGDMIGQPPERLLSRRMTDFLVPRDRARLRGRLGTTANLGSATWETSLIRPDGAEMEVEMALHPVIWQNAPGVALNLRDISRRRATEARIQHLTQHDLLTGSANRATLQARITQDIQRGARFGVIHLTIDRFKSLNDMFGPEGGDRILATVAERLRQLAGPEAMVARIGGDEFAILLRAGSQPEDAAALAQTLLDEFLMPSDIDGQRLDMSVSMGIVLHPQDGSDAGELLTNADVAVSRAKAAGGGTFLFFEQFIDRKLRERRLLERDLRAAIAAERDLELLYQPLVSCGSGRIIGFEALLRWNHPQRGEVMPDLFIPIAEESGLIQALGRWVLETACVTAAAWPSTCNIAVNLSPLQFRTPDLPGITRDALRRSGLAPQRLELEVTEGLLVEAPEEAAATLRTLKTLGVRVALDDFGSGYSSLAYLRRFPFDKLKIDRSFIMAMDEDDGAQAIVRAVLAMAHSLGLETAAEGVETPRQLALLQTERCGEVQGWLIGRPMAASAVPGFLNARLAAQSLR